MATVTFRATAAHKSWLHRKGGKQLVGHESAPGGQTWKVLPPVVLQDGDEADMDDFDSQWCLAHFPDNFTTED